MEGICSEHDCGKPVDRDGLCFRHRVAGVGFNWSGGGMTYGRKNFSAMTNKEFLERNISGKSDKTSQPRPVRAELI